MNADEPTSFDDENPEWTEEDFARAKPASEVHPPEIVALLVRKPGRPKGTVKQDAKQAVSLRLDPEVLEDFRSGGPGWQSRINLILRARAQMEQLIASNLSVIEAVENGALAITRSRISIEDLKRKNEEIQALLKQETPV